MNWLLNYFNYGFEIYLTFFNGEVLFDLCHLEFAVSKIAVWDWRHLWPNCEDIFDCSKSLLYTIVIFFYCNIFVCNIFLCFCFCNIYFCLYTIVNSLLLQYISELSCTDGWFLFIYLFCLGSAGACVCSVGVYSILHVCVPINFLNTCSSGFDVQPIGSFYRLL